MGCIILRASLLLAARVVVAVASPGDDYRLSAASGGDPPRAIPPQRHAEGYRTQQSKYLLRHHGH
jgi:hypothetical protein